MDIDEVPSNSVQAESPKPPLKRQKFENSAQDRSSKQGTLQKLAIDSVTSDDKKKLDESLGLFLFSLENPLEAIESHLLKKFLALARPGYQMPSTQEVLTKILDKCSNNVLEQLQCKTVTPATLTLMKDKENEIEIYAVPRYRSPIFIKVLDIHNDLPSLETCLEEAVDTCKARYNLVIDSCLKSSCIIEELRTSTPIVTYWCMASVAQDLLIKVQNNDIKEEISELLEIFSSSHTLSQIIQKHEGGSRFLDDLKR